MGVLVVVLGAVGGLGYPYAEALGDVRGALRASPDYGHGQQVGVAK